LACKLKKAICGLKQAPQAWFVKPASTLVSFDFDPVKCANSVFFHATSNAISYFMVYVDDIPVTGNSPSLI
jgi:hypothetical protein